MNAVIAILGPTASGKSAHAMKLAREHNGEIISCDSMQVYRGMNIGTAKATQAEQQEIPHHMLDICDPNETYTAARYANEALACIRDIQSRGKMAIICGGTGFYWQALHLGISNAPPGNDAIRARLAMLDTAELLVQLHKVDPVSAEKILPNNRQRLIRAIEVHELSGKPLSSFEAHGTPRFEADITMLNPAREALYARINARVDSMIKHGLLDEIEALLSGGTLSVTASNAIGYKEFIPVVRDGADLAAAIALCKQNTRRYAKRQVTFFRPSKPE